MIPSDDGTSDEGQHEVPPTPGGMGAVQHGNEPLAEAGGSCSLEVKRATQDKSRSFVDRLRPSG
jgi:hypothetical protein